MTLKRELDNPESPLRCFFASYLAASKTVRASWTSAVTGAHPAPLSETMPADLLGQASSLVLTSRFDPSPEKAVETGVRLCVRHRLVSARLAGSFLEEFAESRRMRDGSLYELAVIGGWFEQLYRGGPRPSHVLSQIGVDSELSDLRALVLPTWVRDLATLDALAEERLADLSRLEPRIAGATFSGSHDVGGADADVLCGAILLEIKCSATLGLSQHNIFQVVTYALLDYDDQYRISEVALYNSRYGALVVWPLTDIVKMLAADETVEVAQLRTRLRDALASRRGS